MNKLIPERNRQDFSLRLLLITFTFGRDKSRWMLSCCSSTSPFSSTLKLFSFYFIGKNIELTGQTAYKETSFKGLESILVRGMLPDPLFCHYLYGTQQWLLCNMWLTDHYLKETAELSWLMVPCDRNSKLWIVTSTDLRGEQRTNLRTRRYWSDRLVIFTLLLSFA